MSSPHPELSMTLALMVNLSCQKGFSASLLQTGLRPLRSSKAHELQHDIFHGEESLTAAGCLVCQRHRVLRPGAAGHHGASPAALSH